MSFSFSSSAALREPGGKGVLSSSGFPSALPSGLGSCCVRGFPCRKIIGAQVIPSPQKRCKNLRRSWPDAIIASLLYYHLHAGPSACAYGLTRSSNVILALL